LALFRLTVKPAKAEIAIAPAIKNEKNLLFNI
jgi:hypothetical protein